MSDNRLTVIGSWWLDPAEGNRGGPRAATGGTTADPDELDKLLDRAYRYVENFKCGSVKVVPFEQVNDPKLFADIRKEVLECFKEEYPNIPIPSDIYVSVQKVQPPGTFDPSMIQGEWL